MDKLTKEGWTNSRAHQYKPSDPKRNSADWNDKELFDLTRSWLLGSTTEQLAFRHQRKVNAVEIRLARVAELLK